MNKEIADKIVEQIIFDLSDRRGLSGEWDGIDSDIKKEIMGEWSDIIFKNCDGI
jgi:hypothetical protein